MTRLINPNLHAIIIHFPIALLSIGVMIELFSFLWRRSTFRLAGQWMILIGTLGLVPAATTGMSALANVVSHGQGIGGSWIDAKSGAGFTNFDWQLIRYHVRLNGIAAGIALFAVIMWLGSSDHWRRILRVPVLFMLLVALALMMDGAWHGGEMVYRQGFAVEGVKSALPQEEITPQESIKQKIQDQLDSLTQQEIHLFLAGLTFALAAAALGLSIRRSVAADNVIIQRVPPTVIPASQQQMDVQPISLMQALNDPGDEIPVSPRVPSARFWFLALLIGLLTSTTGLWLGVYLVGPPKFVDVDRVRQNLHRLANEPDARRIGVHIVFGGSIIALTFILGILARFAPRSRVILSALSFVLVLVMAGQIWVGTLMLFDNADHGPLLHFQLAPISAPQTPSVPLPTTLPTTQASALN